MSTPLSYRCVGADDWRTGRTVNVSRTGVLFTGPSPCPETAATLEFVLALPSLGLRGRSQVQCQGHVVRRSGNPDAPAAVAVTIDSYRITGIVPDPASTTADA